MKPKQFTEEKGGVVHVHFEPKGTYIREDDVYRLMKEYADHQLLTQRVMPRNLTAENGAKALLNGEFKESIDVANDEYCGCGNCDFCHDFKDEDFPQFIKRDVVVSWSTIKKIYKKIVEHYVV